MDAPTPLTEQQAYEHLVALASTLTAVERAAELALVKWDRSGVEEERAALRTTLRLLADLAKGENRRLPNLVLDVVIAAEIFCGEPTAEHQKGLNAACEALNVDFQGAA